MNRGCFKVVALQSCNKQENKQKIKFKAMRHHPPPTRFIPSMTEDSVSQDLQIGRQYILCCLSVLQILKG